MQSIPKLDRLRDRFSVAGAKDDRRDAYVQADSLRTDRRLFRRLQVADPRLIELRAWSRLAEELGAERVRLSNRMRHQLWHYYPQMQKLTKDLAAPWFLELWAIASTPAKAGRLRKSTVERLLKQHRIRRMDAETVLRILREPAIKVAEGVAEAASIHIRSLVARLGIVNRELREAERKLDELCTAVSEIEQTSGESLQRRDVAILRSMPGIGRINLGTLLSEASGPLSRRDYEGLRTLSGAAPVTKRSGKSLIVVRRYAAHVRLRNTVYHWARVATQRDPRGRARILRCANGAARMDVLSVVSRTDCLPWCASFRSDRRCLIRTLADLPHNGGHYSQRRAKTSCGHGEVLCSASAPVSPFSNRGSFGNFFRQPFVRPAGGVVDIVGTPFVPTSIPRYGAQERCRRKIEMTPGAQRGNDTRVGGGQ